MLEPDRQLCPHMVSLLLFGQPVCCSLCCILAFVIDLFAAGTLLMMLHVELTSAFLYDMTA